ncbi:hypothetical protein [Bosea massiliensis]|uniref:Invasion associated locus B family protein n=1 Tax=Bosea massiliensis TaxID=151419 RepID=A0ABW0NV09_9HYPH
MVAVLLTMPIAADAASERQIAGWTVTTEESGFSDSETVWASREGEGVAIAIRCIRGQTSVGLFTLGALFGAGFDEAAAYTVRMRIDKGSIETMDLQPLNKAVAVTARLPFAKPDLYKGRRLFIEVTSPGKSRMEYSFSLAGASAALAPVFKACNA